VFFIEFFFTFLLMTSILHNIFPRLSIQSDTVLAVVSVITCIYFCIRCCGPLTGACFNPCIALVNIPFVALVRAGTMQPNYMAFLPVYILGPLAGAVVAALFCKFFVMPHVPHYYDTMLTTFREEQAKRYSTINTVVSQKSLNDSSQDKILLREQERLIQRAPGIGDKAS
jgi:hypothetical protein